MPDSWRPTASVQSLSARSQIVWSVREFFHRQGFLEVHTPILSHDTVIDRHIDPVRVRAQELACPQAGTSDFYLQTSPEFGMKRLIAAGMTAIYQIAPVFRSGERGMHHNPEFTMLEWYRVGDSFSTAIAFLQNLVCHVLGINSCERMTYRDAFARFANCQPIGAKVPELRSAAAKASLAVGSEFSDEPDEWLNLIFSACVQPKLGLERPVIITHYPASQSALARISSEDPQTAERFELFARGIELANGYHELLDAAELQRRNSQLLQQRTRDGKPPLPSASRLLDAMQAGLPACCGCALGIDRLIMVATGQHSINDVIAFPIEIA